MLKIICTLMALMITLAVLCSNNVESRVIYGVCIPTFLINERKNNILIFQNLEGIPSSQLHYLRVGKGQTNVDSSNEDDHEEYLHTKRKSELLSSLYGLPYALVNKRNAN